MMNKPAVGLSPTQYHTTEDVLSKISDGKRTILANLCARFGKTIWTGSLIKETKADITIIASYVLTVTTSFETDLSSFEQFNDIVQVDTKDEDYQEKIDAALLNGKQVVAYVSMCPGSNRASRLDYLFNVDVNQRMLVIDEADFGVHADNQASLLINGRKDDDIVIIMTGTNSDKAAGGWVIDHTLSVMYPELVLSKTEQNYKSSFDTLTYFDVDHSRTSKIVDVEFYQMDVKSLVELTKKQHPKTELLPSWKKFTADPTKAEHFFANMLKALFVGMPGVEQLNIEKQVSGLVEQPRIAMMFLSGNMKNKGLKQCVEYAKKALPNFEVIEISGNVTTNAKSQALVQKKIKLANKENKSVLLLSKGMSQRSFSIPEITELYLAYDEGGTGATIQKMSRALTPSNAGKIGRIFSLSFNPNRDDKFDAVILETAANMNKKLKGSNMKNALSDVLLSIDIFACKPEGAVRMDPDTYLAEALARNSIARVIGRTANIQMLSSELQLSIAKGRGDYITAKKQDTTETGKITKNAGNTSATKKKTADELTASEAIKLEQQVKEVITYIVENMHVLMKGTDSNTIDECLTKIEADLELQDEVQEAFDISWDNFKELFNNGIINLDIVELLYDK